MILLRWFSGTQSVRLNSLYSIPNSRKFAGMNMPTPLISKRCTGEIQRCWMWVHCRPTFLCTGLLATLLQPIVDMENKLITHVFHVTLYPCLLPCKSLCVCGLFGYIPTLVNNQHIIYIGRVYTLDPQIHNYKTSKNIKHLQNTNHNLGTVSINYN